MKTFAIWSLTVAAAAFAGGAHAATTYSLAADFSDVNNPNGAWSFTYATPLAHHMSSTANDLNPGIANGFWGVGPNINGDSPFLAKATANSSTLTNYSANDFLTGQVILHSANSGAGTFINWTAPAAGVIDVLNASVWYAHSPVNRINEVLVTLDGVALGATLTINNTSNQTNRSTINGLGLAVDAGDVLSFEIRKQAGQAFGSITGIDAVVQFTAAPVPEPATYGLMLAGLAAVGAAARRRDSAARG